jgi:protein-disulfide isomerase
MGSPTAPIDVIEYGDFECPVCAVYANLTEPDVRTRLVNTGIIRMRYIDYPLPMHPNTWNASRAAACADEQGKFWEMHDALFQNQDRWSAAGGNRNPDKYFKELGKQIGVKTDQFDGCVDTKKYQAKIQAHERMGAAQKAGGTPTFVIGKNMYMEPLTFDKFKLLVDTALAAEGKTAPALLGDTAKGVTVPKKK